MIKTNMDSIELFAKQDGGGFLRAVVEALLQLIMEAKDVYTDSPDRCDR